MTKAAPMTKRRKKVGILLTAASEHEDDGEHKSPADTDNDERHVQPSTVRCRER
jgi:hypothetical protein